MLQWLHCKKKYILSLSLTGDIQNELPYLKKRHTQKKHLSHIAVKLYVLELNSTEYNF